MERRRCQVFWISLIRWYSCENKPHGCDATMSSLLFLSGSLHSPRLFLISWLSFSCHRHTSGAVHSLGIILPMGAAGDWKTHSKSYSSLALWHQIIHLITHVNLAQQPLLFWCEPLGRLVSSQMFCTFVTSAWVEMMCRFIAWTHRRAGYTQLSKECVKPEGLNRPGEEDWHANFLLSLFLLLSKFNYWCGYHNCFEVTASALTSAELFFPSAGLRKHPTQY